MRFRRKNDINQRADNLSKTGAIYYSEWIDQSNREYIKIEDLAGGRGVGHGTFSNDLFPVDEIGSGDEIVGFDVNSSTKKTTKDNNMSAFLRAIKSDIAKRRDRTR